MTFSNFNDELKTKYYLYIKGFKIEKNKILVEYNKKNVLIDNNEDNLNRLLKKMNNQATFLCENENLFRYPIFLLVQDIMLVVNINIMMVMFDWETMKKLVDYLAFIAAIYGIGLIQANLVFFEKKRDFNKLKLYREHKELLSMNECEINVDINNLSEIKFEELNTLIDVLKLTSDKTLTKKLP